MRGRLPWALLAAVGLTAAIVFAISRLDFGEAIREVTLPLRHDDIIRQQAEEKNLDPALIAAVIYEESRFRDQTSSAGARGLMQVTPETAARDRGAQRRRRLPTEDLANPDINIRYGTYLLSHLLDRLRRQRGGRAGRLQRRHRPTSSAGAGSSSSSTTSAFPRPGPTSRTCSRRREQYRDNYADDLGL